MKHFADIPGNAQWRTDKSCGTSGTQRGGPLKHSAKTQLRMLPGHAALGGTRRYVTAISQSAAGTKTNSL